MLQAGAAVELRVENISSEDCRKLEAILSAWAASWRTEQQLGQEDACHAQLMCGSLKLDVARLVTDGVLTWQDTLHPAQPLPAAGGGELVEEPRYERGTGELLAPALVDSTLLLPGGAAAARRRAAAQASVGEWADGSGAAETPQPKRRRVGLNKCHNCGSYKHSMNKCPVPYDQKRVSAAVAEARAERGPSDPLLQMRVRYFNLPGSSGSQQAAGDRPKPGVISQELAEALGMASTAAPLPWQSRMQLLGKPPRYCEQSAEDEAEAAADQLLVVYRGSDDDEEDEQQQQEEAAGDAAVAASGGEGQQQGDAAGKDDPGDPAAAGAAAADLADGGGGSSSSDDEDDFIPFDTTAGQQQHDEPPDHGSAQQQPAVNAVAT